LDISFIVLTDFDPKGEAVSQEDADSDDEGVGNGYGENRVVPARCSIRVRYGSDQKLKRPPTVGAALLL
jgi:hypothetical protein